jgi:uncharacterized protein YbaR (Trm112 family)
MDAACIALLACPACAAGLARQGDSLVCAGCGERHPVRAGIPVLRARAEDRTERVREFYSESRGSEGARPAASSPAFWTTRSRATRTSWR